MRLISVTTFSVALLISGSVLAAPSFPVQEQRNPVEWFLSDLGNLFSMAVERLDQPTDSAAPSVPYHDALESDPDLFFDDAIIAAVDEPAPPPSRNENVSKSTTENATRPPISDFFKDLFAIFSAAADQTVASADLPDADATPEISTAEPVEGITERPTASTRAPEEQTVAVNDRQIDDTSTESQTAKDQQFDLLAFLEEAAIAYDEQDGRDAAPKGKPLLSDFFASFGEAFDTDEPAQSQIAQSPEKINQADKAAVSLASAAASPDETVEEAAVQISQQKYNDDATQLEMAPWQVTPHVAVFAPSVNVFDETQPLPVVITPVSKKQVVSVEIGDTQAAIRKRQLKNPAARNHVALGQTNIPASPEDEYGFFDHLMETFVGEDATSASQQEVIANKISDRIVPEEQLDLGYAGPDAKALNEPENELETIGDGILKHVDLYLGQDTVIGRAYEPSAHSAGTCMERPLQVSIFCVTKIAWPADIAQSFAQDTAFTLPGEGVVRYENGRVSRAYTPFKASDFAEVVKFMQRRFGPPLEREVIWMHMIEAPKLPNTTFRWRAVSADRKDSIVMEVRNFDDLRRSFADLDRGMVRLYRDGSRPIFKHLSTMDLMLIQRRRISQAPVSSDDRPTTN